MMKEEIDQFGLEPEQSLPAIVFADPAGCFAQGTRLEMPKNKYAVEDDVKLGAKLRPRQKGVPLASRLRD
jgi:hypothetical protein